MIYSTRTFLLCGLLISVASLLSAAQKCDETFQFGYFAIAINTSITTCIECVIGGVVQTNVQWTAPDGTLTSGQNGVMIVNGTLVVSNTSQFFSGNRTSPFELTCSGISDVSEAVYKAGFFAPVVSFIFGSAVITEGDSITLRCDQTNIPGSTSRQWLNPQGVNISTFQNLVLNNLQQEDAGEYQCQLTSAADGSTLSDSVIIIVNPPNCNATSQFDFSAIAINTSITTCIECVIGGEFQTNVQWIAPSGTLTSGQNGVMIVNGILVVSNTSQFFSGPRTPPFELTCSGEEDISEDIYEAGFFAPDVIFSIGNAVITEGDNITLNCDQTNFPGSTSRQWLNPQGVVINTFQNLILKNLQREDAGEYQCQLTSVADGSTLSDSEIIIVTYPTTVTSNSPHSQFISLGSFVTLNCSYDSVPPSTVTWFHNGVVLTSGMDNVVISVSGSTSTLTRNSLQVSDGGDYLCKAINTLANGATTTDSVLFNITIQVNCMALDSHLNSKINYSTIALDNSRYSIGTLATYSCTTGQLFSGDIIRTCLSSGLWNGTAPQCLDVAVISTGSPMAGQSFFLTCSITGADTLSPTITYQWFRGQSLVTSSSVLSFDSLFLSDAGQYRCMATVVYDDIIKVEQLMFSSTYDIQFQALNFQLQLKGLSDCRSFVQSDATFITIDITNELTLGLEHLCRCGFNSSFIFNPFILCFDNSPQHVTYRAVLTATPTASTVQLATLLDQWIRDTRTVVVGNTGLTVDDTCSLVIKDRDSPECSESLTNRSLQMTFATTPPSEETPLDIVPIVGGVGGMGILIIIAVFISCVWFLLRRQRIKSREMETKDANRSNNKVVMLSNLSAVPSADLPIKDESTINYQDDIYEEIDKPHPPTGDYQFVECVAYKSVNRVAIKKAS